MSIEYGVDVINLISPELLGIEEIGKRYRGKIAFFSSIDHQKTISFGTEKDIRYDIEKIARNWSLKEGGLVLYFANLNATALGIDFNRQKWIVEIIKEYTNFYNKQISEIS